MMKGKVLYDPPRFMTVATAAEQLLEVASITNGKEHMIMHKVRLEYAHNYNNLF